MYASLNSVNPADLVHLRSRSRSRTPSNSNPPSPVPGSPMLPPHSPLLHSASASSVAGHSAFIAVAPPTPDASSKLVGPSTHSRTRSLDDHSPPERPHRLRPSVPLGVPNLFRRRKKTVIAFVSTLFLLSLVRRLFAPTLLLLRFKLVDYAYSEGWGFPLAQRECGFRKEPIVFVKGAGQVSIVWEIGKCRFGKGDWSLRWRRSADVQGKGAVAGEWISDEDLARNELELDYDGSSLRSVYSSTIDSLVGGEMYDYEVLQRAVPVRTYSFPFLGPAPSADAHPDAPQSLEIACVADNQFNLRTFDSILSRILSTSRMLSSSSSRPPGFPKRRPHLLLHAGDPVQNPHDLAQWQTDFWDPLARARSRGLRFASQVPILLARGNHDWDKTGRNVYVGGLPRRTEWERSRSLEPSDEAAVARGGGGGEGGRRQRSSARDLTTPPRSTFYSFSPHARVRIVVLDSNLVTDAERAEQERWLEWEVGREEWQRASLRLAVVHTAPWIEWWNARAWKDGHESQWSTFVRHRLVPILVRAKCSLLLSGHSHAYSRGFVPASVVPSFTSRVDGVDSASLPAFAVATVGERSWEKATRARSSGVVDEPGLVTVVFGGAGGTLDRDRVETWGGLFERGKWGPPGVDGDGGGNYHFGHLTLHLAGRDGTRPARSFTDLSASNGARGRWRGRDGRRDWRGKGEWVYRAEPWRDERACAAEAGRTWVEDWLEWRAIDVDGATRDRIGIVGHACV
ncbi:hypothetical protein JCM11491_004872 [Sporobolomyces phaffii]